MGISNLSGQTLGQYELRDLLGVGGMGSVYRGFQRSLKRAVAVKILTPEIANQPGYIERFNREAETAAGLEHQNIIPIYDYGTQRGISYVVMRLLTGGTLSERLTLHTEEGKPLPSLGEIAQVLRQLGSALDYAHSHGVIHRDIKPSNVMFDNQGNAYLVDFGIAKLLQASQVLTGSGIALGTPTHMPPEQWTSSAITPATDQYALGVMTYSLVTGRAPFEADTPYALMHKHLNEMPTPPQVLRPDIPPAIAEVLARALAKPPQDRFPSCTAFAQAFESAIAGQRGSATQFFSMPVYHKLPQPTVMTGSMGYSGGREAQPLLRSPVVWAMAAALVVLVALVAFMALRGGSDGEQGGANQAGDLAQARATNTAPVIVILGTDTPSPEATDTPLATATPTSTPTATPPTTSTVQPSDTPLPTPTVSDTPDLQVTADAMLAERLTAIAESWTGTPTPDIEQTAQAMLNAAMTSTAAVWTATPTPTSTYTPTITATATPEWDGSMVGLGGFCDYTTGEAVFTVTNLSDPGIGDMQGPVEWRLFQNGRLVESGALQLNGGESIELRRTLPGMLDFYTDQRPGYPYVTEVAQVANCERYTATPTASITPRPDRDGDGVFDDLDQCPDIDGPAALSGCPPTETPVPAATQQIVYMNNLDLYLWDSSTQTARTLMTTGDNYEPDIYSDWVAFASARDGRALDIYVVNIRTGSEQRLTADSGQDRHPSFSPDGERIAFTSNVTGNWDVYIVTRDGSLVTQMTNTSWNEYAPTWSPDGAWLAYQSNASGSYEIHLYNVQSGQDRQLTSFAEDLVGALWSPDGSTIACYINGRSDFMWATVDVATGAVTEHGLGVVNDWLDSDTILLHRTGSSGANDIIAHTVATGAERTLISEGTWSAAYP